MTGVFYWLFNMSITAALTGLFVLLLRLIKKIPRRVILILWILPFLRAVVPVSIGGKYTLMSLLTKLGTKTVIVIPAYDFSLSVLNSIGAAESYGPLVFKTNILESVFAVSGYIWLVVFIALSLFFLFVYIYTTHELKDAVKEEGRVFYSHKVLSPALYGVLRPRIVLPEALRGKDIRLILLHEETHRKHLDNLWRLIAFAVTALHWFNPFAWIFLKCFLEDLELACDERVLKKIGEEEKAGYARALLDAHESKTVFSSAFGGAKIRSRIENILSYRKATVFSSFIFILLIAAIAYFLLANAG